MGSEITNAVPSKEPVAAISPAGRFFGVFTEPVKTFADIAQKPGFWAPLIALIVVTFAGSEFLVHKVGMEQIVRRQIEMSGRASTMSAQQLQSAVTEGAKIGGIFASVGPIVGVPIVLIILAAFGLLIMKVVFGLSPNFKTAFSVTAHAYLPMLLGGILSLVVIGFGDPANMNPQNLIPTNIGFFLSQQSTSKALYSLATSVDVLSFWVLALLGIGFAATSLRKARPRTVFFCFLALWVIWVLIKTGFALI
ncbi:MAG: YIP1 family protein [Terriglobia bacterium]